MTAVLILCSIMVFAAVTAVAWRLCRAPAREDAAARRFRAPRLPEIAFRKPPSRRVLSRSARRRSPPDA